MSDRLRLVTYDCLDKGEHVDVNLYSCELTKQQASRRAKFLLQRREGDGRPYLFDTVWIYQLSDQIDMRTGEGYTEIFSIEDEVFLTEEEICNMIEYDLGA